MAIPLLFLLAWVGWSAATEDPPVPLDRQVVLETTLGSIVIDLFPGSAPQHVEAFRRRLAAGEYEGTTFHRAVPLGIIQGGDPLSRDPDVFERYGTGGLNELKAEFNDLSHTRGAVSAVLVPGNPDSAGAQFFICVTDQVQLDGHYTIFGRVVEGLETVARISQVHTDDQQRLLDRIEIVRAFERDRPPPEKAPFEDAGVEEMARYRVRLSTSLGPIELELFPDLAPEHVRQFLRLVELGLYDGTRFHRIVPGFVVQGGSMAQRADPVPERYLKYLKPLKAEFSSRKHERGVLSMARGGDPDSGLDSFFICLESQPSLDEQYTVFGRVISGWETIEQMELSPLAGESPVRPIVLERAELIR